MGETHQVSNLFPTSGNLVDSNMDGANKWVSFTQGATAGDANSTATLFTLRAGEVLYNTLSTWETSAFGAGRTLDLGSAEYRQADGTVVAANPTAIFTGFDVSAAANRFGRSGAEPFILGPFNRDVDIVATVRGGTIPAAATIQGTVVVEKSN